MGEASPAMPVEPVPDRVDLWLWTLDEAPDAPLSTEEAARAERFLRPEDGRRFAAARTGLRRILARYRDADPAELAFQVNPWGKPALEGGPFFNLSHSHDRAALAVCWTAEIGIDIERVRPVEAGVAEAFAASERATLARLSAAEWPAAFHRAWTRKEAVLKALGRGLSLPLASVEVTLGEAARLLRLHGDAAAASAWSLQDLDPGPGFAGALAAPRSRIRLVAHDPRDPLDRAALLVG